MIEFTEEDRRGLLSIAEFCDEYPDKIRPALAGDFLRKLAERPAGDAGLREKLETLQRFEPYAGTPYVTGGPLNKWATADAEMEPDSQGDYLRRSDVLAALADSDAKERITDEGRMSESS